MEIQKLITVLRTKRDLSWEDYCEIGRYLKDVADQAKWYLGELALKVETKYGEHSLEKFAKDIGVKYSTLKQYRWVVSKFKRIRDVTFLPFTAYRIAAGTDDPDGWIEKAEDEGWTAEQLYREIKKKKEPEKEPPPKKPRVYLCKKCNRWVVEVDTIEQVCSCNSWGFVVKSK